MEGECGCVKGEPVERNWSLGPRVEVLVMYDRTAELTLFEALFVCLASYYFSNGLLFFTSRLFLSLAGLSMWRSLYCMRSDFHPVFTYPRRLSIETFDE